MAMNDYWLQPSENGTFVGWTSQPDTRGTFDIIWGSAQTAALCAWVSICVNVPAPGRGSWDLLRDKFYFVLLTLLGPELVFLLALPQYQSAKESVKMFKKLGKTDWTLTHGFYADMGGIHVKPPSWKSFPINGMQLHYLVSRGYMEYPQIPLEEIKAKSKTDGLARVVTLIQTLYFLVGFFARVAQGLALTTLELTIVGFIFCTLATSICWWRKPNDIELPHFFELPTGIEKIIRDAGEEGSHDYRDTPLDFISPQEWNVGNLWVYYVNILRQIGVYRPQHSEHSERPMQRIRSLNFPRPRSRSSQLVVLLLGLGYIGTFFGAWNFYFPSRLERLLWRTFTGLQFGITAVAGSFELYYAATSEGPLNDSSAAGSTLSRSAKSLEGAAGNEHKPKFESAFRRFWNKPCNNSEGRHPTLNVPLRSLLLTTPLCAIYVICRWYLLFEDIIGLRSLPPSAYVQVDWTRYWPSF